MSYTACNACGYVGDFEEFVREVSLKMPRSLITQDDLVCPNIKCTNMSYRNLDLDPLPAYEK